MSATAQSILATLELVESERLTRTGDPALAERVAAIKSFQQARFSHTYADLLQSPRYGAAARFFLEELYGPDDFTGRDAQFARVVPAMVRLFPREVVETVADLARLHALSEALDTEMARHLATGDVTAAGYVKAWLDTGRRKDRQNQIDLTLEVATRLDALTQKPLLRHSLRLMRGPARAAGLGELQKFLEAGFDTFRAMKGADEFIQIVREREQVLASCLFASGEGEVKDPESTSRQALSLLPGTMDSRQSTALAVR